MDTIKVKELIIDSLDLDVSVSDIGDEQLLSELIDSINALELVSVIEDEHNLSIPDEEIFVVLETVKTISQYITSHGNA
ncbi:MAG: acyl carrier protein [Desulfobacter sp.]